MRNIHHINVHGDNPPDPIETFDQLVQNNAVPQQIITNLNACGYKEPTPIQRQAIPMMANVSNLLSSTRDTMQFKSNPLISNASYCRANHY